MRKVLVIDDNEVLSKRITALLKDLDHVFNDDIKYIRRLDVPVNNHQTLNRPDGWYRQFDKSSKKKNFKQVNMFITSDEAEWGMYLDKAYERENQELEAAQDKSRNADYDFY